MPAERLRDLSLGGVATLQSLFRCSSFPSGVLVCMHVHLACLFSSWGCDSNLGCVGYCSRSTALTTAVQGQSNPEVIFRKKKGLQMEEETT